MRNKRVGLAAGKASCGRVALPNLSLLCSGIGGMEWLTAVRLSDTVESSTQTSRCVLILAEYNNNNK